MLGELFLYFPSKGKFPLSPGAGQLNDGCHLHQGLCSLVGSASTPSENLSPGRAKTFTPIANALED